MPALLVTTLRQAGQDVHTITALAGRALVVAADIDMKYRVAIVEDERIRIRPPLAVITSQDPT